MLTESTIKKLVTAPTSDNYIGLHYSILPNSSNGRFEFNACIIEEPMSVPELRFFAKQLKDHRLVLTVGLLVKSLSGNLIDRKKRFGENELIADLRTLKDGYFIRPGESVLILTNEWIKLDQKNSIQIISKVSNYAKGLSVTASFVDSQWKGLVQLMITNLSSEPHPIKMGDEIASAFFYELNGELTALGDDHAKDADHSGRDWFSIIQDCDDPFSIKKPEKKPPSFWQNMLSFIKFNRTIFLWVISGSLLGFIGKTVFSAYQHYSQMNTEIKILKSKTIETGQASILIKKGQTTPEKELEIELNRNFSGAKSFIQNISPVLESSTHVSSYIQTAGDVSKLKIIIVLSEPTRVDKTIKIEWFVIP